MSWNHGHYMRGTVWPGLLLVRDVWRGIPEESTEAQNALRSGVPGQVAGPNSWS